ncbi:uncharacterized protein LOC125659672 [Ostrea edulis]|uniref:uncharacterized protein LOC125659672 n=1 Tax=Ostrea edulis TaxID=37623 RepID=UPI0020941CF9|nr:uncharacterized protein LOC125659672 [Ostrea edulis]XP_048747373.1 uncharacterized protein LOC125659672 [Ostrea edulis]XP_048747375.1 uncharacterized protein LOC125659672 [Ostrea edulis]
MPFNTDFSLSVLVGNTVLPEYFHNGVNYVECDLCSPVSFKQRTEERVGDEIEIQDQPVTPFSVCISVKPSPSSHEHHYYRLLIDGQKVTSRSIEQGRNKIIKGFRDGISLREFLFSMPSLKQTQSRTGTSDRVGWIDVECWNARLKKTKRAVRTRHLNFTSGSKSESLRVTQGKYMMATTKAGRVLELKNAYRSTDYWDLISLRSKLSIKYVAAQDLRDMGVTVIPIPYPVSTNSMRGRVLKQDLDLSQGLAGTCYDPQRTDRPGNSRNMIADPNSVVILDKSPDPGNLDDLKVEVEVKSQSIETSSETMNVKKEVTSLGTSLVIDLCDLDEETDVADYNVIELD